MRMKKINKNLNSNHGQVALITLLLAAVVMTVGLSLSKKSTVDTKLNTNEELAKQAFKAAESGVDNYLGTGLTTYVSEDTKTTAEVAVTNVGNGSTVNFDQFYLANKSASFWLVGHNSDGDIDYGNYYQGTSLKICVQNSFNGAVMVDYFYRDASSNYLTKRYGYNVGTDTVSGFTNLSLPLPSGDCLTNYREIAIAESVDGIPLLLIIKPIGVGTKMYLSGDGEIFPIQGEFISSKGKSGELSTSSEVSRQVGVLRLYEVSPFLMNSVVTWGSVLSN